MSEWSSRLRQASFRGVPFAMLSGDHTQGRRVAVHEFPDRDDPFVEDLGGAAPRLTVRGFLIDESLVYGGGDVLTQRTRMEEAASSAGPGALVHPTRGPLQVHCLALTVGDREEGGWFELAFEFIEAGASTGLDVSSSTSFGVASAVDDVLGIMSRLFNAKSDRAVGTNTVPGDLKGLAGLFSTNALTLGGGAVEFGGSPDTNEALRRAAALLASTAPTIGSGYGAGARAAAAANDLVRAISSVLGARAGMAAMVSLAGSVA